MSEQWCSPSQGSGESSSVSSRSVRARRRLAKTKGQPLAAQRPAVGGDAEAAEVGPSKDPDPAIDPATEQTEAEAEAADATVATAAAAGPAVAAVEV